MLTGIKKPDREGREAMYYAERQDFAYRSGSYEYLDSIAMVPRLAVIAAYVRTYVECRENDDPFAVGERAAGSRFVKKRLNEAVEPP